MADQSTVTPTSATSAANLSVTPANVVDTNLPPQASSTVPTLESVVAQTPTTLQGQFERIGTLQTQTALQSGNLVPYTGPGGGYIDLNTGFRISEATYANQVRLPTTYSPAQIAELGISALQATSGLTTGSSKGMTSSEVRASQPMGLYSSSGQPVGFGSAAYYSNYSGSQPVGLAGYLNQTGISQAAASASLPAQSFNKELGVILSTTSPQGVKADLAKITEMSNLNLFTPNYNQNTNPMFITDTTAKWDKSIAEAYGSMDTRQGKLDLVPLEFAGLSITGAALASKGWADSVSQTITKYRDIGYAKAPEGLTKSWVGFTAAAASTVPFVASLPYAAVWSVTNPTLVPGKAAEILGSTVLDIGGRGLTNPTGVAGELVGMYAGGKAIGAGTQYLNVASPIKLGVAPIATSTAIEGGESGITYIGYLATQKPALLSSIVGDVRPLPQVKAFVAAGEYTGAGVGPATEFLKGLPEVNAPPLMRVRPGEGIQPLSSAQQTILDPFFRDVAKGKVEEKYINAALTAKQVLPQSESIIGGDYRLVGGFSESELFKVQPAVKQAAMEKFAEAGGKYVGSTSLVDIYGKEYVRDVSKSDIDVSIPAKNIGELKYGEGGLNEIFGQNVPKIALKEGEKGYVLSTGETEHVAAIMSAEKAMDVRTFDVTTPRGNVLKYGTPEYQIETKFSRLGGRGGVDKQTGELKDTIGLRYTQEGGIEVPLELKKGASDFADIFSGAGYLSRETAIKGLPGVSRAYEEIATDIRAYAEATGNAAKFSEIAGNALVEAKAARQVRANLGGLLGVELGVPEYPIAIKASTKIKEGKSIPVAQLSYPEATTSTPDLMAAVYPESTTSTSYGVSAPVISSGSYGAYPGGISPDTYYGVANFAPGNYNRFVYYPESLPQIEYPKGEMYPTGGMYPGKNIQPYPSAYPSGKGGGGFGFAANVKITSADIFIPKPEERITAPPIKTRNYFKFHEVLQGIDYSKVNLKTGYGGRLATIKGKKMSYIDTQFTVKSSPMGTMSAGGDELLVMNQFIEQKPVRKTYTQMFELPARGKPMKGPDFSKATFNIPKKQRYNRRKK